MLLERRVDKRAVAAIAIKRVAARMPQIRFLVVRLLCRPEMRVAHDSLPCVGPHVRHVKVGPAIAVIVEPVGAHARPDVFYASGLRLIAKMPAAIDIQVLAAEVVGDIQIRPAIIVEVAPGRREAEPVIVLVHPRFRRAVLQKPAAIGI